MGINVIVWHYCIHPAANQGASFVILSRSSSLILKYSPMPRSHLLSVQINVQHRVKNVNVNLLLDISILC